MAQYTDSVNRRTALKTGGLLVSGLAVGLPTISGTAAAAHIPTIVVDAPPRISTKAKGQITTVIYPGGDKGPEDVVTEVEAADGGFKLGPDDGDEPDPNEITPHADAFGWRLVNNGVHGMVLGVFFDASTADGWFTSDDDAAKVSAVTDPGAIDDEDIIAGGRTR